MKIGKKPKGTSIKKSKINQLKKQKRRDRKNHHGKRICSFVFFVIKKKSDSITKNHQNIMNKQRDRTKKNKDGFQNDKAYRPRNKRGHSHRKKAHRL